MSENWVNFIIDSNESEKEYILEALNIRNQLLTTINGIDQWIYVVKSKMFYAMYCDGNGNPQTDFHKVLDNSEDPNVISGEDIKNRPLSVESQSRWNNFLLNIQNDRSIPDMGFVDLDYKDHSRRIRSFYRIVKDANGMAVCVVGNSEDISKTREKMQHVIDEQNDYIKIINGLKSAYNLIIYIDLKSLSFKVVSATVEIRNFAKRYNNAQSLVRALITKNLQSIYQDKLSDLVNLKELSNTLNEQKYISFEYQTMHDHWNKLRIQPAEYDNQGNIVGVVLSTENVDLEHREKDLLIKRSEHDSLTGIYNRYAGVAKISSLLKYNSGTLIIMDCDKFKHINDTFGHIVGDLVLVEIAQTLSRVLENQVLFRLGGDEFVAFVTDDYLAKMSTQGYGEQSFYDLLKRSITEIDVPELCGHRPSISLGCAKTTKFNPLNFDQLYKLADQELYKNKD